MRMAGHDRYTGERSARRQGHVVLVSGKQLLRGRAAAGRGRKYDRGVVSGGEDKQCLPHGAVMIRAPAAAADTQCVHHADRPDLRLHDWKKHKAMLFDEVPSPKFVVSNKKVLQAHVGRRDRRPMCHAALHLRVCFVEDAAVTNHTFAGVRR